MIISIDTETTGLDLLHSAKPFLVTTCNERKQNVAWQWNVNPLTRQPVIPSNDLEEIYDLVSSADEIVFHNSKFDVHALQSISHNWEWDWSKTHDTLVAAHVLASNMKKDLYSLCSEFLDRNLHKHEKQLENKVKEAHKYASKYHPLWKIATKNMPELPSNKKEVWRSDYWLPKAIAVHHEYLPTHPYHTSVLDYANIDSAGTLALWMVLKDQLIKRDLWNIYLFRLEAMRLAHKMERRGITYKKSRISSLLNKYQKESDIRSKECTKIALEQGYNIAMPKKGANDSLRNFYEHGLKLPAYYNKKSSKRTYDKEAMAHYRTMLEPCVARDFINLISQKGNYDSSISYLRDYARFGLKDGDSKDQYKLHANYNPTATNTLRWSSSNPNSTNVRKEPDEDGLSLRYCFGPKEGREWWSLDYKNIELRIPFYESGEKDMIDLFERSKEPPFYGSNHILVFSVLWPDLWNNAVKEVGIERAAEYCKTKYKSTYYGYTKNGNFAIQYGSGESNADKTYHQKGAYQLINQRFEKLRDLNYKWIQFANKYRYVETLPDRTIDPTKGYPLLCTMMDNNKVLTTVPLSYHVQGTAMQVTASAMIKTDAQLEEWRKDGFDAFITMQVHDEIVFDLPKRAHPKINKRQSNLGRMRVIQKLMESCGDDLIPSFPTPCGIDFHEDNWSAESAVSF